jgi:hypothetical protein
MKTAQEYFNLRANHALDCPACAGSITDERGTSQPCTYGASLTTLYLNTLILDYVRAMARIIELVSSLNMR